MFESDICEIKRFTTYFAVPFIHMAKAMKAMKAMKAAAKASKAMKASEKRDQSQATRKLYIKFRMDVEKTFFGEGEFHKIQRNSICYNNFIVF